MTYGDEQAEARRLRSILEEKPGGSMTPPARPDPVAALAQAMATCGYADPDPVDQWRSPDAGPVADQLAESGYVLVNVDMLAEALRLELNRPHPAGQYEELAVAILAALKGPAR